MTYRKDRYIVEAHLGIDVLHKDVGPEFSPTQRMVERLLLKTEEDIRVWINNRCIFTRYDGWRI